MTCTLQAPRPCADEVRRQLPNADFSRVTHAVWQPTWVDFTAGRLSGTPSELPTGQLERPFAAWHFCMPTPTVSAQRVVVETLSHGRGPVDTELYVVGLHEGAEATAAAERGATHVTPYGYGKATAHCVSRTHAVAPRRGAQCPASHRESSLSQLEFDVAGESGALRGYHAERSVCFRAYVMLRDRYRMVADLGLRVRAL